MKIQENTAYGVLMCFLRPGLHERGVQAGVLVALQHVLRLWAKDPAPEINTSEIVDVRWQFPLNCQWHISNGSSLLSGIFERIVAFPVDVHWNCPKDFSGIFQWNFPFVISGVVFSPDRHGEHQRLHVRRGHRRRGRRRRGRRRGPVDIQHVRPISLLRISLRFVDSRFPGNSPWT